MNYLAHLHLSPNTRDALFGSLLGDFVKGRAYYNYPCGVRYGITLHRLIDKFTDSHPIVKQSRKRLQNKMYRYSGILVDVFYDHFLAVNWHEYSEHEFEQRLQYWIDELKGTVEYPVPERMQKLLFGITAGGMLQSYKTRCGIETALKRISTRLRFANNLDEGIHDFHRCYDQLQSDFSQFFPELTGFVHAFITEHA